MLDPVSAISIATAAFSGIKKAVEMGREIEDVIGQLTKWSNAVSDIDKTVELSKKPSIIKPLRGITGKSLQAQAMEAFAAKRKAQQMRDELRQLIQYSAGQHGWEDFLRIEAEIKKQRQKEVYAEIERREKLKEMILTGFVVAIAFATLIGITWLGIAINEAQP